MHTNFIQTIVRGRHTSQKSSDIRLDTQLTDMRYSRTRHWSRGWNLPSLIYILAAKRNFKPQKTRLQKQWKRLATYWFQSHFQAQWRGFFYFIKSCIAPFIMRFCCLSFLHFATVKELGASKKETSKYLRILKPIKHVYRYHLPQPLVKGNQPDCQ